MLDFCILVIQSRRSEPREALKPWPVILKRPQTSRVTQFMKLRAFVQAQDGKCMPRKRKYCPNNTPSSATFKDDCKRGNIKPRENIIIRVAYAENCLNTHACITMFVWACKIIMYHYQLSMCGLKIQ